MASSPLSIQGTISNVLVNESALSEIDVEHRKIHEGLHYVTTDYDSDVDTGAVKIWHFQTPNNNTEMHLTFEMRSSKNGLIELWENPTINTAGTAVTIFNSNRNSSNVTTAKFYKDATLSASGSRMDVEVMGTDGAAPTGDRGGFSIRSNEIELKKNEDYALVYTTLTDDNRVSVKLEYYED